MFSSTGALKSRIRWPALLAAIIAWALTGSAVDAAASNASLPALLKNMHPMQVEIVRDAQPGCQPNCAEWISAEGDIVETTPVEFRRVLGQLRNRKLPVFINSGGGSIEAAMLIGQMLRLHGLDVSVTRTEFTACHGKSTNCAGAARGEPTGQPDSYNAYCASACTLVLAAGVQRLASPWSHVGVHQIIVFKTQFKVRRTYRVTTLPRPNGGSSTRRTLIREQTLGSITKQIDVNDDTYRPMEVYLSRLGVGDQLVPLMEQTPNSDIHWMTGQEMDSTRLATRQDSGEALLKRDNGLPVAVTAMPKRSPGHAQASIQTYFQGRPIWLLFDAAYDRQLSIVILSVAMRQGGEALRSQGLFTRFDLDSGHRIEGYNVDATAPFSAMQARAPASSVCPLRQSGSLQLSLHPTQSLDNQPMPLRETQPVMLTVASVPGLPELLTSICASVASAGN